MRNDLPAYADDSAQMALPSGLYLGLFHGRKTTDEDLDDWGFNGPVIGPLKFVHTTYATEIKLEFESAADRQKYFPADNMIAAYEGGSKDADFLDFKKLNDPAVRQALLDSGAVTSFTLATDAHLHITEEGLVEFEGEYFGDWSVYVVGNVLPTAKQIANNLRK